MHHQSIAAQLARQVCAAMRAPVAPQAMHAAERLLLDSLACALGAHASPAVIAGAKWATRIAGAGDATILASGQKTSVLGAAMVNGMMVRDLDMNDTYFSTNPAHPSDNLGTCLAVGEAEKSSAEDVLKSWLIAFEVQMRICEFTSASFFRTIGWDQTTVVTIASAAAAGALLHLDENQMSRPSRSPAATPPSAKCASARCPCSRAPARVSPPAAASRPPTWRRPA